MARATDGSCGYDGQQFIFWYGAVCVVVAETERLRVHPLTVDDAAFILRLLNEPTFIRHIADKGVRTLDDALAYLRNGPMASVTQYGFGLSRVDLKRTDEAIGMCGHGLRRVIAVVNPDNHDSSRMLEKLGFRFEKMVKLAADEPDIRQFALALSPVERPP